jgi:hypothetical protein
MAVIEHLERRIVTPPELCHEALVPERGQELP